jgi:hypothetical protein
MDNLKYLFSAYFHQDWHQARATWEEVVDEFLQDDATTVAAAPAELDALLSATDDDAELSQLVLELGCDYHPDLGERGWLTAVRDRIQRSTGADLV